MLIQVLQTKLWKGIEVEPQEHWVESLPRRGDWIHLRGMDFDGVLHDGLAHVDRVIHLPREEGGGIAQTLVMYSPERRPSERAVEAVTILREETKAKLKAAAAIFRDPER